MVELLTASVVLNLYLIYKVFHLAGQHYKALMLLYRISRGEASIKFDASGLEIKATKEAL